MKNIRIVYYTETYGSIGGDSKYLGLLIREMSRRGVDIICFCNSERLKRYLAGCVENLKVDIYKVKVKHAQYPVFSAEGKKGLYVFLMKILRRFRSGIKEHRRSC